MGIFSAKRSGQAGDGTIPAHPPESRIEAIGHELLDAAAQHRQGWMSAESWSERLMDWAMSDPAFKVQMFRFVDVFPVLKDAQQIHRVLTDYLSQPGVNPHRFSAWAWRPAGLRSGHLQRPWPAASRRWPGGSSPDVMPVPPWPYCGSCGMAARPSAWTRSGKHA